METQQLPQEIIDKYCIDTGFEKESLTKKISFGDKCILRDYLEKAKSIDATMVKSLLKNGLHSEDLLEEFE